MVFVVDLIINFPHAIVAIPCGSDGAEEIIIGCSQTTDKTPRPKASWTDQILGKCARRDWRIRSVLAAGIVKYVGRQRNPGIGRLRGHTRQPDDVLLFFIAREIKQLVLHNRSAHRKAVVFIAERRIFRTRRQEWRRRSIELIAVVVVSGTMNGISARLDDQVDRATRVAAGFRAGLRLRRKFVNRIDRQHNAGDTGNTSLIDRRDVVPEVVVVHSVDLPIILISAGTVHGAEATYRVATIAGRHRDQLGKVSSIQRNVLHDVRSDSHILSRRGCVQRYCGRRDFHCRGSRLQRQLDVQRIDSPGRYFNFVHRIRREALRGNGHFVLAQWNVLKSKRSVTRGHRHVVNARRALCRLHLRVRHRAARRVRYRTVDRAAKGLRVCCNSQSQNHYDCEEQSPHTSTPIINFQSSSSAPTDFTCRVAASPPLPTTRPCFKKNHSPKRNSALHLGAPRPYSRQLKKKILLEPIWLDGKDATPKLFALSKLLL